MIIDTPKLETGWLDLLYQHVLKCAEHPAAFWLLGVLAFSSAIFFPLPVDPLFTLVALQRPRQIPLLVLWCAGATTLGGLVMYSIGFYLYTTIGVWILDIYGCHETFARLQAHLNTWGFSFLMLKAFTPFPYKLVALSYGVGHFSLVDFCIASFVGRALRFSFEGLIVWKFGPAFQTWIRSYLKPLVVILCLVIFCGFVLLKSFF